MNKQLTTGIIDLLFNLLFIFMILFFAIAMVKKDRMKIDENKEDKPKKVITVLVENKDGSNYIIQNNHFTTLKEMTNFIEDNNLCNKNTELFIKLNKDITFFKAEKIYKKVTNKNCKVTLGA